MIELDVGGGGRELAEQGHRALPWGEGNPASGLEWRSFVDIDAGEPVAPRRGGDVVPLPVQSTDRQWVRHGSMPVLRVYLQQRQAVTACTGSLGVSQAAPEPVIGSPQRLFPLPGHAEAKLGPAMDQAS